MEKIKLVHPYWIRIIGWCFLPLMLIVSLYCLFLPVWEDDYSLALLASGLFLGGGCLYMTINALMTLPFMNVELTLSEISIQVSSKRNVLEMPWESISKIRHVASTQVLHLYDENGKRFLSVTEQLTGYNILVGMLSEKSGLEV
ncbi:hypothetical protein ACOI22_08375 [Glaciecola sp. 2405UD65-10]|uniref:hypothetical protein n=1 Tax=Glaciecola sp. 2405UD65-10 TaxID=3397244 RepID=UPI003B59D5E9